MGAEISAGPYPDGLQLGVSATAALVVRMTDPWYVPERDGSEVGCGHYQQDYVDASSFRAANEEIPWTLVGYFNWAHKKFAGEIGAIDMSWNRKINQEIFDDARDFVRRCALEDWHANYSY
ncbi:hypothetical protein D3C71_77220 [compost metagenome]